MRTLVALTLLASGCAFPVQMTCTIPGSPGQSVTFSYQGTTYTYQCSGESLAQDNFLFAAAPGVSVDQIGWPDGNSSHLSVSVMSPPPQPVCSEYRGSAPPFLLSLQPGLELVNSWKTADRIYDLYNTSEERLPFTISFQTPAAAYHMAGSGTMKVTEILDSECGMKSWTVTLNSVNMSLYGSANAAGAPQSVLLVEASMQYTMLDPSLSWTPHF